MKVLLVVDPYAVCDRCDKGAFPDDPLLKFGQFVEWVTLHKTCFDIVVRGVEDMFAEWRTKHPKSSSG